MTTSTANRVIRNFAGDMAMRLRRVDPVRRLRCRHDGVNVRRIIHLVGLKRSGLHAVANWLLGTVDGAVLLNNSPMKRFGSESPMERTLPRSPLPIHLYRDHPVIALTPAGGEISSTLQNAQRLLVVLWQSQALDHLGDTPLLRGVTTTRSDTVLLLRDPFNWLASVCQKASSTTLSRRQLHLWESYAREYAGTTNTLSATVRINFNRWLDAPGYREQIAQRLALPSSDRHATTVTNHAGGSSFDGTRFHGCAHAMPLEDRWRSFCMHEEYCEAFRVSRIAVDLALEIFELSDDLRRFARNPSTVNDENAAMRDQSPP